MKSIRQIAYATVLTISALNFAPSLASAQDESGSFTLPHEVHWENAVVPAGEYRFTLEAVGPSQMLKLMKISGASVSFMLLVNDTDAADTSHSANLVIDARSGYVKAMNLPQFEMTLHFKVPEKAVKQVAEVRAPSLGSSAR